MKRGRIAEPIWVHATGGANIPLEFSWRGKRHRVREVIRLLEGGRYQLRTSTGMRCQVSRRSAYWQIDQLLFNERSAQ